MATIDSLNISISEMDHRDALNLILRIRESRRTPKKTARKKSSRPASERKRYSMEELTKNMSAEDVLAALKSIGVKP